MENQQNISELVLRFVSENLSHKSEEYILSKLFNNDFYIKKFCDERPPINDEDKDQIVGHLNTIELELSVIKDSLLKRIKGTRERINYLDSSDYESVKKKYGEESRRLLELLDDYSKVFSSLYNAIERRLGNEMRLVFEKNPKIISERYHWSEYNDYSGYIFTIFSGKTIVISNQYAVGGD